jgi:hypothetical protein
MKINNFYTNQPTSQSENELRMKEYYEYSEIREDDYQASSDFLFDKRLVALY